VSDALHHCLRLLMMVGPPLLPCFLSMYSIDDGGDDGDGGGGPLQNPSS
jgi:hypothetical protein